MSRSWIRKKQAEFVRDVVRDYCVVATTLTPQFDAFDGGEEIDFSILRDLLGQPHNKGVLWRLKDTAHLLFADEQEGTGRTEGYLLDWALGYIFHETLKLREDAYQRTTYGPAIIRIMSRSGCTESPTPDDHAACEAACEAAEQHALARIVGETRQSMRREVDRIRYLMQHSTLLFAEFLRHHSANPLLARFLYNREELVRGAFGTEFSHVIETIYSGAPHMHLVLASQSLRHGGWVREAHECVQEAQKLYPNSKTVLQERRIVDNWMRELKV